MTGGKARRGYSYHVSREEIRKYMRLSPKEKLDWLEEVNEFIERFAPDKTKELHRRFRHGEI